jgi:V8-like Glu-specific endopeptidase
VNTQSEAESAAFWTSERMATVQPLTKTRGPSTGADGAAPATGESAQTGGALPSVPDHVRRSLETQLHRPLTSEELQGLHAAAQYVSMEGESAERRAYGSAGALYSSTQLVPQSADTSYPYSTVGRLLFTINGAGYTCSASAIGPRLILTAGHCVHEGNGLGSGWHANFNFIPAYHNGAAPFGQWGWAQASTTSAWYYGGGGVPNAGDFAIIVARDNNGWRLGNVVGWLGTYTYALNNNHLNMLGYPCNIDGCSLMHQVTAQSHNTASPNCVEYGSDMGGGSSGGPWVQNFGNAGVGEPTYGEQNSLRNLVTGVTSYGYVDVTVKIQGASMFDSTFTALYHNMCGVASNCS